MWTDAHALQMHSEYLRRLYLNNELAEGSFMVRPTGRRRTFAPMLWYDRRSRGALAFGL